jgi:hypothetical protein
MPKVNPFGGLVRVFMIIKGTSNVKTFTYRQLIQHTLPAFSAFLITVTADVATPSLTPLTIVTV